MSKDSSKAVTAQPPVGNNPTTRMRGYWRGYIARAKTKGFGSPLRVILMALVIFIVSQVVAGTIVGLFLSIRGINVHNYDINASPAAQFFYILMAEGLAVLGVLSAVKSRGLKVSAIGLGRRPRWSDVKRGAIGFVVFYGLLILIGAILSYFFPDITNQHQDVGFNSLSSSSDQLLAFVALVILPPLGEETLVRGYLYSGLRSSLRYVPALLITSLMFGLAHLQATTSGLVWAAAVDTFILSVVLVALRERTGALYAGMLVHMANNFIAFGVHFHTLL